MKKILNAIEGVSVTKPMKKKRKTGLEEVYEDIKAGRITHAESVDDMFNRILGI